MVLKASVVHLTLNVLPFFCLAAPLDNPFGVDKEIFDRAEPSTSCINGTSTSDPTGVLPLLAPIPRLAISISSDMTTPSLSPASITITNIVTEVLTITVSASPFTSILTETMMVSPSAAPITVLSSQMTWVEPVRVADLDVFNVSHFAAGQSNLEIVNGTSISKGSLSTSFGAFEESGSDIFLDPVVFPQSPGSQWANSDTILQIRYPAGSIDPRAQPQGGAEFYATPIDISDATSVTLEYSVLFPADFDWVRGGKLPGLYGGHTGCSGGNDALDCFSTRLMWRPKGAGELYLYAPKERQTTALCDDPQSVCDTTYGLSIGRGSFYFTPGGWTHVRQTVTLNTPGVQDGCFTLEADGIQVINRTDIFYRDVPSPPPSSAPYTATSTRASQPQDTSITLPTGTADGSSGLLGPLLGGGLIKRYVNLSRKAQHQQVGFDLMEEIGVAVPDGANDQIEWDVGGHLGVWRAIQTDLDTNIGEYTPSNSGIPPATVVTEAGSPTGISKAQTAESAQSTAQDLQPPEVVSFIGLFFSTFFGGHGEEYATPTDQYTWFKDFVMTRNW